MNDFGLWWSIRFHLKRVRTAWEIELPTWVWLVILALILWRV